MPHLFEDRYQRVLIDPESLSVKVLTGQVSRDAINLSQGTAEQIYLLLRIVLVDVLTAASSESCPMILDDVTVHFDAERKVAVLDLLHQVSQERQVIIFLSRGGRAVVGSRQLQGDRPADRARWQSAALICGSGDLCPDAQ